MLGKKPHDNEVLSQAAFVDAIIPAFSTDIKKDTIARRQEQQLDPNPNLPLRALYIKMTHQYSPSYSATICEVFRQHLEKHGRHTY